MKTQYGVDLLDFEIEYYRDNTWDVIRASQPIQTAKINAINEHYAISKLANKPGMQSIIIKSVRLLA